MAGSAHGKQHSVVSGVTAVSNGDVGTETAVMNWDLSLHLGCFV